jgi:hypothetical protein
MWKKFLLLGALGLIAAVLSPSPASAQATRTWVSGVGDDANPCSRTAPCKTFAGAIAKTAAGGEIDALDPGGFGALTITKSITIDGGGGQVASVLVSGTNGINVAAGSTDVVILRNLRLQGLLGNGSSPGTAGLTAITFSSGHKLIVDNCAIYGFNGAGISDSAAGSFMAVRNTTISNVNGTGIAVVSSSGGGVPNGASLEGVQIRYANYGVAIASGNNATLSRSVISNAKTAGVETDAGGSLFVDNTEITNGATGVQASGTVVLGNSDVSFNTTGVSGGGTTNSYGNNRIFGNNSAGTTPTVIGQN